MDYIQRVKDIFAGRDKGAPRACVLTYGCAQNENDSEKIKGLLSSLGYEFSDSPEDSDLVILNTCAVRESAENKIFGIIGTLKRIKRQKPEMIIAVCGCMVMQQQAVDRIRKSYPFVDLVFGTGNIAVLPKLIYDFYMTGKKQILSPLESDSLDEENNLIRNDGVTATISIMYGCDNYCSYCIVPYVRGRERSRRPGNILSEFTQLVDSGYKEITLLGQNVNSYGKNIDPPCDFADLLNMLCKTPGEYTIRFLSSHPKDISRKLIDTIRDNPNISRHIHLPVQSGSDRILSAMNRKYTKSQYLDIINYARNRINGVTFSSDIIVGFPGETFEDYLETEDLVKTVNFTQLFTYIFSKRSGTRAALLPDDTPRKEKTNRLNRLIKIQQDITFSRMKELFGTTQKALVFEENDGIKIARLDNGFIAELEEGRLGEFENIEITGKNGTVLTAVLSDKRI